jgi:hypothetical protein
MVRTYLVTLLCLLLWPRLDLWVPGYPRMGYMMGIACADRRGEKWFGYQGMVWYMVSYPSFGQFDFTPPSVST